MSEGPTMLTLAAGLDEADLTAAVAAVLAACREVPTLTPCGWHSDQPGSEPGSGPVDAALQGVMLAFTSPHLAGTLVEGETPRRFTLGLDAMQHDRPAASLHPVLRGFADLVARLAERGILHRAVVRRLVGGHCLPVLPLAEDATHLLACTKKDIVASYGDPAGFAAGWEEVVEHGAIRLHLRAADALGNPDFLRRILHGHMAMARAARPGTVRFYAPRFADGEFAVLDAGEPTLTGIGYDASSMTYEFAGHLRPGVELRPIDLHLAWRIASSGEVEGRPVREVRAVFMDRAQASRAAPLLRAAGVIPCWEDSSGRMHCLAFDKP
jgi:hypothetical protein